MKNYLALLHGLVAGADEATGYHDVYIKVHFEAKSKASARHIAQGLCNDFYKLETLEEQL